jgi:hypothetical protein
MWTYLLDGIASGNCTDDGDDDVDGGCWHIALVVDAETRSGPLSWIETSWETRGLVPPDHYAPDLPPSSTNRGSILT